MRLTRRSIISRSMLGIAVALFAPGLGKAAADENIAIRLRRLFKNSKSCARLARQLDLQIGAGEVESFGACMRLSGEHLASLSDRALLSEIKRNIRRDFEQGRIHLVDGWQVSATELVIIRAF